MILGYDLSNYAGPVTAQQLSALRNRYDLRRAVLELQDPAITAAQVAACTVAGVPYDLYLYLYNRSDYLSQIDAWRDQLAQATHGTLWLDCEDETAPLPAPDQLAGALAHAQQLTPAGIYTSPAYWALVGGPELGDAGPLWLARWTGTPPLEPDGWSAGFGGWVSAPIVQYAGNLTLDGIVLDLDAWRA